MSNTTNNIPAITGTKAINESIPNNNENTTKQKTIEMKSTSNF